MGSGSRKAFVLAGAIALAACSPEKPAQRDVSEGYRQSLADPESSGFALTDRSTARVVAAEPSKFVALVPGLMESQMDSVAVQDKLQVLRALGKPVSNWIEGSISKNPDNPLAFKTLGLVDALSLLETVSLPKVQPAIEKLARSSDASIQMAAMEWLVSKGPFDRAIAESVARKYPLVACKAELERFERLGMYLFGLLSCSSDDAIRTLGTMPTASFSKAVPAILEAYGRRDDKSLFVDPIALTALVRFLGEQGFSTQAHVEFVLRLRKLLASNDPMPDLANQLDRFLLRYAQDETLALSVMQSQLDTKTSSCLRAIDNSRLIGAGLRKAYAAGLRQLLIRWSETDIGVTTARCAALMLNAMGENVSDLAVPFVKITIGFLRDYAQGKYVADTLAPASPLFDEQGLETRDAWLSFAKTLSVSIPNFGVVEKPIAELLPPDDPSRQTGDATTEQAGAVLDLAMRMLGSYGHAAASHRDHVARFSETRPLAALPALAAIDGNIRALVEYPREQLFMILEATNSPDDIGAELRGIIKEGIARDDGGARRILQEKLLGNIGRRVLNGSYDPRELTILRDLSPLKIPLPEVLKKIGNIDNPRFEVELLRLIAANPEWISEESGAALFPRIAGVGEDQTVSAIWKRLNALQGPIGVDKSLIVRAAYHAGASADWDGPFFERNGVTGEDALPGLVQLLNECQGLMETNRSARHVAHVLGRGDPTIEYLLRFTCRRNRIDDSAFSFDSAPERPISRLARIWRAAQEANAFDVRDSIGRAAARLVSSAPQARLVDEIEALQQLEKGMTSVSDVNRLPLTDAIGRAGGTRWKKWLWAGLAHPGTYLLLILIYPLSRRVQALFLFSEAGRKFLGLWYVDTIIKHVPWVRSWMLQPFRTSFASGTRSNASAHDIPFFGKLVLTRQSDKAEVSPEYLHKLGAGVRFIEGRSGLGKTRILQHLARSSRRPWVFLRAVECAEGVPPAICDRMYGRLADGDFVEAIVHSGGLEVYIDGLNEASVEARTAILTFARRFFDAHITIATQPLRVRIDTAASWYELQPLAAAQAKDFLVSCVLVEATNRNLDQAPLVEAARQFFEASWTDAARATLGDADVDPLTSPLDLTAIASLIVRNIDPHWSNVRNQQIEAAKDDYRRNNGGIPFPMEAIAAVAYEQILRPEKPVRNGELGRAIATMVDHRLMIQLPVEEQAQDSAAEFRFRHERIRDAFAAGYVSENLQKLAVEHACDPRFRGVYVRMIRELPDDAARALKDLVVNRASAEHDHSVSDDVVNAYRERKERNAV